MFAAALAALASLVVSGCAALSLGTESPLTLVWYGLARRGTFQHPTYAPLSDGIVLGDSDGVQIFLSVKPSCYVYVLHQTTDGEFAVWWPTESHGFSAYLDEGRVQTLPSRGREYSLRSADGTEAIYLVAARKPINDVAKLTVDMRWLFATAQALAAQVPAKTIRQTLPRKLTWKLDLDHPVPIDVVEQRVPVATTVRNIGELQMGDNQYVTTADGGTYIVRAEQIRGRNVVARVIRIHRRSNNPD